MAISLGVLFQVAVEGVEPLVPERTVALDPRRRLLEWPGDGAAPVLASLLAPLEETRALEDPQVLRDRGTRDRVRPGELRDGRLAPGKAGEDPAADRVRERREREVEARLMTV